MINLEMTKRTRFFLFAIMSMILVISPKSVGASFCIKPTSRYFLDCKSDNCQKGFNVEYNYAGLVWWSSRPRIFDLNNYEIEKIIDWKKSNGIVDFDGVIEIAVYEDYCDFPEDCSKEDLSGVFQLNSSYDELEQEIRADVIRENFSFYLSETLYLFSRLLPIVLAVLLPIFLSKFENKFWLRFGLVIGFQIAWTILIGSTIICCGDILSEFFFIVTWIIIVIESIIIFIIRPRNQTI